MATYDPRKFWARRSRWGKVAITISAIVVLLIVVGAIVGEEKPKRENAQAPAAAPESPVNSAGDSSSTPSAPRRSEQTRAKATKRPPKEKVSPAARRLDEDERAQGELRRAVAEVVEPVEVKCGFGTKGVTCGVTYEIEELVGIDTDEELLNAQRKVWAALFDNPRFQEGFVELEAPVVSVGGKESIAPVLRVRCNRAAARQIDWENVRSDGIKQLCQWEKLVG